MSESMDVQKAAQKEAEVERRRMKNSENEGETRAMVAVAWQRFDEVQHRR
jgi:hypothetical protein